MLTIECRVGEGDRVDCGSRYGRIRMGSQVDVFIPDASRVEVVCRPGQHVRAGESVLATIRPAARQI